MAKNFFTDNVCGRQPERVAEAGPLLDDHVSHSCLLGGDGKVRLLLVENDAFDGVELAPPRCLRERFGRGIITCLSTRSDPSRSEINVLGMVFIVDARR